MKNLKQFDMLTAILLGELYNSFPVPIDVKSDIFLERIISSDDEDSVFNFEKVFSSTVRWLDQYGYIQINRDNSNLAYSEFKISLSEKGLHLLRKIPKSLQPSKRRLIGEILAKEAKKISGTLATQLIMDAINYGVKASTGHS